MDALINFNVVPLDEFLMKLGEQLYLIFWSSFIAIILGIVLGILVFWHKRIEYIVSGTVSMIWTIPSLALFGLLLPWFGLGTNTALIALTLYGFLPVIQNTITGLEGVSPEYIEAANGLGMTRWQRLKLVEFPLAYPSILTGIRTTIVFNISMSTLAAFIGAGGLGDFINRGLAINDSKLLLLGAIPIATMALMVNFIFSKKIKHYFLWIGLAFFLLFAGIFWTTKEARSLPDTITVGSKNFTEQIILAELIAQTLETKTPLKVLRKFNLGSSAIVHQALLRGDLDIYPEYTGTAYLAILHLPYQPRKKEVLYHIVKDIYQSRFHITWLAPFGFDSAQLPAVKKALAAKYHLNTICDLVPYAPQLTIGAPAEFFTLPTGMPALKIFYGLTFKDIKAIDLGLMYQSIFENAVDVIFALNTDPRVTQYHLQLLADDNHAFLPYYAAPVIRDAVLKQHPEIYPALAHLNGILDVKTMRFLNGQVDIEKKSPQEVVRTFLKTLAPKGVV
jgi:osmoprotectant transport system permease protein